MTFVPPLLYWDEGRNLKGGSLKTCVHETTTTFAAWLCTVPLGTSRKIEFCDSCELGFVTLEVIITRLRFGGKAEMESENKENAFRCQ